MASSDYASATPYTHENVYSPLYTHTDIVYASERDGESFSTPYISWAPPARKQQSQLQQPFPQHQHPHTTSHGRSNPLPPLNIQPQIHDVEHMKSLSLYSASSSNQTTPTFEMSSNDWQQPSTSLHGYQSQAPSAPHYATNPGKQGYTHSPTSPDVYPSHYYQHPNSDGRAAPYGHHQAIVPHYYEDGTVTPQHVDPSEFAIQSPPPGSYSNRQEELSCDPRYVSQQEVHGYIPHHSHLQGHPCRERLGHIDAECEEDVRGRLTGSLSPISGSPRGSPRSDLDDEDRDDSSYDPRSGDEDYRPPRLRSHPSIRSLNDIDDNIAGVRLRSMSSRYAPYPASPTSEMYSFATRARRSISNATSASSTSSASSSSSYHLPLTPTSPTGPSGLRHQTNILPIPVPVPNLTKKSRGRRVPTIEALDPTRAPATTSVGLDNGEFGPASNPVSALKGQRGVTGGRKGAAKGVRMFTCKVLGCGKCFARGEHLKRHVRSIHTHEKPHKCMYPGCGKDFSRHDNLNQHQRIHKDWVPHARNLNA
ncbi:hypothetical protein DL96DRAFT_1025553 [Flagelloscypha sp. PMI_526]|nr:hypothetical protein DL96DRAFT_1025553 [Flagelloscypha sp. PMI_526]